MAFEYLASHAGEDGKLDLEEAKVAFASFPVDIELELAQEEEGCGNAPTQAEMDAATPEGVFDKIDSDKSGDIDAEEGKFALGCAVEWGLISQDEAEAAFEFLAKAAGDDEKLSKTEAKAAMKEVTAE
jgi:hypothetical protein